MKQALISFNDAISRYVEEASGEMPHKTILDIGCGTGFYTHFFGKNNTVTGVDLQSCVQKQNKNFRFVKGDATALPLKDYSFDVAVSFDVIEHIENDVDMIKEAYRVLKKGGHLILGTPNRDRLIHGLLKLVGKPVKYPLYIGNYDDLGDMIHVREYTNDELKSLLVRVGFRRVEMEPYWLGIAALGAGLRYPPKPLSRFSQYLFARAYK